MNPKSSCADAILSCTGRGSKRPRSRKWIYGTYWISKPTLQGHLCWLARGSRTCPRPTQNDPECIEMRLPTFCVSYPHCKYIHNPTRSIYVHCKVFPCRPHLSSFAVHRNTYRSENAFAQNFLLLRFTYGLESPEEHDF